MSERSEVDKFAEEVSRAFSAEYRKVVDTQLDRVTRPWRILTAWLLGGYILFIGLSVVQLVLWLNR